MTQFLPSDIFLKRYDSLAGTAEGHAGAIVLLENGWALDISQNDLNPSKVDLPDAKFTCTTLRPWPNEPGAQPKILGGNSGHGVESFGFNYVRGGMSLQDIAKTLTALSEQPPASEFTIDEIVDANRSQTAPYTPSQIGKTPIDWGTGAELNADILRKDLRQGILRDPMDFKAPLKFPFFKDQQIGFQTFKGVPDGNDMLYACVLLRTGHAARIVQERTDDGTESFNIETLRPGKDLILDPAHIPGLELPDIEDEEFAERSPNAGGFSRHEVTDVLNALLKRRSIVPEHTLGIIVARNCHNNCPPESRGTSYAITQFDRVQFDPENGRPAGFNLHTLGLKNNQS